MTNVSRADELSRHSTLVFVAYRNDYVPLLGVDNCSRIYRHIFSYDHSLNENSQKIFLYMSTTIFIYPIIVP